MHTYPKLAALRRHTRGAASVRVAMIDGPVDHTHPCFDGATLIELPAPWTSMEEHDDSFLAHGTGIASILFGQVDSAVEGVAPDVTGITIAAAWQSQDITELSLVRALDAALEAGADIIHCAFCLPRGLPKASVSAHLERSLATAKERGVLIVAPSGNDGGTATCAPADQEGVLAVGSLNNDVTVRDTSNYSAAFVGHGLMAIGEDVLVAEPGGTSTTQSGTSVAAPWVTGVAALLLSLSRQWDMGLTAIDCGALLLDTATPLADERAIGGALCPKAALHALDALRAGTIGAANAGVSVQQQTSTASSFSVQVSARNTVAPFGRLVYALGQLAVEPVDDAAFDRLHVAMASRGVNGTPESPFSLLTHLRTTNSDSDLVHFVVSIGEQPRYVVASHGAHQRQVIERLIDLASASVGIPAVPALVDRVALPGVFSGDTVVLRSGVSVPRVLVGIPESLTGWRTEDVADAALHGFGAVSAAARSLLIQLLDQVCEARPNDGVTAADRTLNYAAANATQLAHVAIDMAARDAELVQLAVQPSRYDRPRSDCWDVVATFVDPRDQKRSWWQWVWTVDVGDVRPVTINWPRCWRVDSTGANERVSR